MFERKFMCTRAYIQTHTYVYISFLSLQPSYHDHGNANPNATSCIIFLPLSALTRNAPIANVFMPSTFTTANRPTVDVAIAAPCGILPWTYGALGRWTSAAITCSVPAKPFRPMCVAKCIHSGDLFVPTICFKWIIAYENAYLHVCVYICMYIHWAKIVGFVVETFVVQWFRDPYRLVWHWSRTTSFPRSSQYIWTTDDSRSYGYGEFAILLSRTIITRVQFAAFLMAAMI